MMNKFKAGIFLMCSLLIFGAAMSACTPGGGGGETKLPDYLTYYFDAENGNDANSGTSESAPKQSLEAISAAAATATAENPVKLLFKKGSRFEGNLTLAGYDSTEKRPLVLDSYGEGEGYPVFEGWGTDTEINAVLSVKDDNITIRNLEITGPTAYQGIYVLPAKGGEFANVVIEGCYVHDVNFQWDYPTAPKDTDPSTINLEQVCPETRQPQGDRYGRYVYRKYSAISFNNDTLSRPSWFNNVTIRNNRVINIGKIGINVYNMWDNQPGFGYGYNRYAGEDLSVNNAEKKLGRFPHTNITAYGNYMECTGGDGLVFSGVEGGVIENNTSYYANYLGRPGFWNAGIWVFGSRDILMQYNEAAYAFLGGGDGQGFDIDNACSNITFQYNYAHHNEGGGLLLCNNYTTVSEYDKDGNLLSTESRKGKWENNVVRNNLFAYNGMPSNPSRSAFITIARQTDDVFVYNNTVILRDDIAGQSIINTEDKNAKSLCYRNYYYNNLFYSATNRGAKFTIDMMRDYEFDNNLYFNVGTQGQNAITGINPLFEITGDLKGWEAVGKFVPSDVRVFSAGAAFANITPAAKDILGESVQGINYIGAFGKAK